MRRRDFVLIPLLSLLTLLVMLAGAELAARAMFVQSGVETCAMPDAFIGVRMKPNCVSYRKAAEGPNVRNAFNDCGYRTREPCGTRPAGAVRIAVMGASTAQGFKVQYEQTFAARLTESLTRACGRPVQFQNMGVAGATLLDTYYRAGEALALHPDLVMLVLSPYDLKAQVDPRLLAQRDAPVPRVIDPLSATPDDPHPDAPAPPPPTLLQSWRAALQDLAARSRALVAGQHFLFEDRATFVRLFMLHGEDADYLRPPLRPGWQRRLADLDVLLGDMARRFHDAGVPFMLVLGPQRIQAALLDRAASPGDADPFAIGHALATIAARHDILFADTLEAFAKLPDPEDLFYPVDGHMDGDGHAVFAQFLQRRLIASGIKPFADCRNESVAAG